VSLILEALKKLERDKEPQSRGGFLVMAARPWPSQSGRGLFWASVALAGAGLIGVVGASLWWWTHRSPAPPANTATADVATAPAPVQPATVARIEELVTSGPSAATSSRAVPAERRRSDLESAGSLRREAVSEAPRDDRRAPKPPAAPHGTTAPVAPPSSSVPSSFRLTAISKRDGRAVAILNDRMVYEGDSFDGVKVRRIGDNDVELEIDGQVRVVEF
jgi:hypothetical protein